MKHRLFLAALSLLAITACSRTSTSTLSKVHLTTQKGVTETITNKERLKLFENQENLQSQPYKKIVCIYKESDGTSSIISTYHPNGQVHQQLQCKNGQASGYYKEWHPSGKLKALAQISKGVGDIDLSAQNSWMFEGESTAYDSSGNLSATFYYQHGKLDGSSLEYHPNGNLRKTVPYKAHQKDGTAISYANDGTLIEKTSYSNNLKDGPSQSYWEKNRLRTVEQFKEGSLIDGTYFNPLGGLISQVKQGKGFSALFNEDSSYTLYEYQDGTPCGEVKVFNNKGSLLNTYFQKEGTKYGKEILFNPQTAKPKLSIDWVDGKMHGVIQTWYDNGQPESQKEMSLNKKQGVSSAWYEDGNLMLIEEYEANLLMKGKYFEKGSSIPITIIAQGQGHATLYDERGIFTKKVEYFGGKPVE